MPSRREFLGATGGALTALSGFSASHASTAAQALGIENPGIQLYSVREPLKADFEGTLARLAEIGYQEVELAGLHGRTPVEVRTILNRVGLRAPAGHVSLEAVRDRLDQTLDEARILGHEFIVVAWIDQSLRTAEGLREAATLFSRVGEGASQAGLRFAYHNHDFEFHPVGDILPYDFLLGQTDPTLVLMELDLFWIRKGGRDPLDYFARWPGRFPLVHIKDMTADGHMVNVGEGVIDWRTILSRRREAGIRHFFAEHDEPGDALAFARVSYDYLRRLRLGGRGAED